MIFAISVPLPDFGRLNEIQYLNLSMVVDVFEKMGLDPFNYLITSHSITQGEITIVFFIISYKNVYIKVNTTSNADLIIFVDNYILTIQDCIVPIIRRPNLFLT